MKDRVKYFKKPKRTCWLCQCSICGTEKIKETSSLKDTKNLCDCRTDVTGQTFGRLTAIRQVDRKTKTGYPRSYYCECQCGNHTIVRRSQLISGEILSCGCLLRENSMSIGAVDLTGQTFGKLTALYPLKQRNKFGKVIWVCQCSCGNITQVNANALTTGSTHSCGCIKSLGEATIRNILNNHNIDFKSEVKIKEINKKFDFFVENRYAIEYDGEQHFNFSNHGWNTEENFKATRERDLEKNKYCFDNNIPLIRIPYDANYTYEDLFPETSRFVLTRENEAAYYDRT